MGKTLPDEPASPSALSRWKTRLSNLTDLVLPTDYPRPIPPRTVEAEQVLSVSERTALAILQLAMSARTDTASNGDGEARSVSPFTILLSAFVVLLHKYTGEEDIVVGSSSQSSNPLVLRVAVRDEATVEDIIKEVVKAEQEAAADEVPFLTLLDALFPQDSLNADTSSPSLFKVRFFDLTDTTAETLSSTTTSSTCDITILISQAPTLRRLLPIDIRVVYNTVLFSHNRINDMLDQLQRILEEAARNITTPAGKISLLTDHSRDILPDPTADLGWDQFEGAITDIFSRNAALYPDRVCIVESRNGNDGVFGNLREFTYKQINEASNVLAHHLMRKRIQREDVVVLYSYRGVDLVVGVMGVLKAGAIFSVVDPAYPPARQNVYLSVAKPSGFVVLRKAGELHSDVRHYINENLAIKCEVPALEISDDGTVFGGGQAEDVLSADRAKASVDPGVELGPDSGCTLSFTSGSTGIPKGVKGRHFSLTHFYPWMKQEFKLTEQERFTMLSGIAHDPIQRDIFTPLFLGAQLRIPTAEDIGQPGRLAEWMDYHKITVTHLTPAMGQLLSANATHPIPTLRHAFFVGDVLTKRDVNRLQYLAPNTHVINMYGTTETQRAVSYLTIPPSSQNPGFLSEQKDIMPAGRGMKNVQLLVINKSGLLCGIGEVGEIYVRSSGLAEGYLDAAASAEKFVGNPFSTSTPPCRQLPYFKGARDRLYRTGDLGRYLPDGGVECTGRADDQVKIRGFRIELKEIDTHLSQCPGVRENVTLVRRDKDEEKTLVSYLVPLESEIADLGGFLKEVREFLKLKLPAYAVPTVIMPLKRMPLTPNGKIDKNALPFPDTALITTVSPANTDDSTLTPLQRSIRDIWAEVLKQPPASIALDANFFDLGGHSILATRLVFQIRKALAVEVPLGIVYQEPTVAGMACEVESMRESDLALNVGGAAPVTTESKEPKDDEVDYAADFDDLPDQDITAHKEGLPPFRFPQTDAPVIFLTGVTGFLGAFILSELMKQFPKGKVIALVRAKTEKDALERMKNNAERHLVWNESWLTDDRLEAVCGDLASERLGLSEPQWDRLCEEVDFIVHNGALVHWVYPYHKLRAPNVLGTIEALRLATRHHLKPFHFVSSTSVLDTEHYVRMLELGERGKVLESDDLEGSRKGLRSGYGQSKWVSEKLVMRARERGVPATIIRPGYIVGDSTSGVGNTDDFLWRLVKGCLQLGKVPRIANVVNMCPVDYVAGVISHVCATPSALDMGVFQMWNPERFRFDDLFAGVSQCGYKGLQPTDYIAWRTALMDLTLSENDNALYPLLHFVLDDLPTSTKSPELDDANVCKVIQNSTVSCRKIADLMGLYLGYFVAVGFLDEPQGEGKENIERLTAWESVRGQIVARTRG
ncbi:large subunit of alpha-aminoadipate reductase [Gaertneriomyces sp. JEL0708]|nr:large subunit of alpha-aminoadipate reductase [Gaertneriomyces sp. JEL0708]